MYKFGSSQRQSLDAKERHFVPGPGNYKSTLEYVAKAPPKYGFGSGGRTNSAEKNTRYIPGPGAYANRNIIGADGPSKTISSKLKDTSISKD